MIDLLLFSVSGDRYALNIENVQKIIQSIDLTKVPNANEAVDGVISYEESVIKILNFRKLIGLESYHEELKKMFLEFKELHQLWLDKLRLSVENETQFTEIANVHKCELGVWLDNFRTDNDKVSDILKELKSAHSNLHLLAYDMSQLDKADKNNTQNLFNTEVSNTFNKTMENLDTFSGELDSIVDSLQKLIIYKENGNIFAIKVDIIEDIIHIEETSDKYIKKRQDINKSLSLSGVLDLDGVAVNVIETVNIPS